jgi:hypothetical protein
LPVKKHQAAKVAAMGYLLASAEIEDKSFYKFIVSVLQ